MLKKDKKTVLVTGGNRGLGLAIVKSLSDAGYFVIAAARSCSSELTQVMENQDVLSLNRLI